MACACIQNNFDLTVDHLDCRTLVIEDHSKWISGAGYDKPETIDLIVSVPSRATERLLTIQTGRRTTVTTVGLFGTLEPQCFPDEVYCFSAESCGIKYSLSRGVLCTMECKITSLISKAKTDEDFRDLLRFQTMLDGIYVNAELGKVETASELYKLLKRQIEHLDCGTCGC
jgi:hypothetical protein